MRVILCFLISAAWIAIVAVSAVRTVQPKDFAVAPVSAGVGLRLASDVSVSTKNDDEGNAFEGRRLFLRENCYICHGGRGGGGMCPSLRDTRPHGDDAEATIRNGTPSGMPPFGHRLTDQDIQNLIAYIRSLRSDREPTFTHWWEAVPTQ